jgi:hypothetical protein
MLLALYLFIPLFLSSFLLTISLPSNPSQPRLLSRTSPFPFPAKNEAQSYTHVFAALALLVPSSSAQEPRPLTTLESMVTPLAGAFPLLQLASLAHPARRLGAPNECGGCRRGPADGCPVRVSGEVWDGERCYWVGE